jgi:hypothetical protein
MSADRVSFAALPMFEATIISAACVHLPDALATIVWEYGQPDGRERFFKEIEMMATVGYKRSLMVGDLPYTMSANEYEGNLFVFITHIGCATVEWLWEFICGDEAETDMRPMSMDIGSIKCVQAMRDAIFEACL